jgi:hypothetical protein
MTLSELILYIVERVDDSELRTGKDVIGSSCEQIYGYIPEFV